MSPTKTSAALATIFMLGAAPLMAQTTDTAPDAPAEQPADAAATTTEAPAAEAPATEAPATEAPATEAPAADAPAADAPADQAAATSDAPPVGAYYTRATHGGWTLRCVKTENVADPCELYQLLKDGEGNSVAEITMIPLQNGGQAVAGATIVTPLETDLAQGLGMRVDGGQVKGYPFNFCASFGCISQVGLTSADLTSLKRGNAATVSLRPYGAPADQVVDLSMSLTGFTAGFAELEGVVEEMRAAIAAAEAEAAPAEAAPAEAPAAQ